MSFELRPHTADIEIRARAACVGGVFDTVAAGLAAATADTEASPVDSFTIDLTADTLEHLLYDFLDQLIYERDVRGVFPVETRSTILDLECQYNLQSTVNYVPLTEVTGREIKAVTFADMRVEEINGEWEINVVFDV